jgi:hypothetical protein
MKYRNESEKALAVLNKILAANPPVTGLAPRDRKAALQLAISVLEGRAADDGVTENERG